MYLYQSHKKRSSDKKNFYHFCTHFFEIGGVLFWQREHFSSKIGWFYYKNHIQVVLVDLKCHFLYIVPKIYFEIWIFIKPLKLKSTKKSQNQAQSLQIWCYILEKKILSINSGIGNNVLPWRFGGFCFRKKFYS